MLSESVYGRTWHAARVIASAPAWPPTLLARRPYDLRHAALSLWLNAGGKPAQIAARRPVTLIDLPYPGGTWPRPPQGRCDYRVGL